MIFNRYNDPQYILNLSVDVGMELILKAREKEIERIAWEMWLTLDGEDKQKIPYGEFLRKFKEPIKESTTVNEEEIMKDAKNILNMFKRSE